MLRDTPQNLSPSFQDLIKKIAEMKNEDKIHLLILFEEFSNQIIFVPVSFSYDEIKNKILKKPLTKWKKLNFKESKEKLKEIIKNYEEGEFNLGIALKLNDIRTTVLDIDNLEIFEKVLKKKIEIILEDLRKDAYLIIKSIKRGFHVYLNSKLAKRIISPQVNNDDLRRSYGFEVKDKGLIVFPPSTFQYRNNLFESKFLHIEPKNFKKTEAESETLEKIYELVDKLKIKKIQKETKKIERKLEKNRKKFKNLKDLIHEIKKRVSFRELMPEHFAKSYFNYEIYHCPFHPPDVHPSFAVYRNEYEYGIDFHDNESYDVIAFYQKKEECDFISALKELSKFAGIKFPQRGEGENAEVTEFKKIKS